MGPHPPPDPEDPMRLLATPARLYRLLAIAEMVTWALLLLGMFIKYVLRAGEGLVQVAGPIHGFVFLAYVLVTVLVAIDQRWPVRDLLLGIGSAVIPFLTLPFERWAEHRGLLGRTWRLREESPRGPAQRVVAAALRRPVPAALIALAVVVVVFVVLLFVGPPVQVGS